VVGLNKDASFLGMTPVGKFDELKTRQVCISIRNHKSEIINIAALPSGIYFIRATDSKGNRMNGKFVKE
jgi:hypothetical protein